MGIIKSINAPSNLSPFSMKDIETQAKAMMLRAREQADQLLAEAQEEAEALKRNAHAEGLAEGKEEGLHKGTEEGRKSGHQQALNEHKAQLADVVNGLTQALLEIDASRLRMEAEATGEVVKLAIAIARRVTKRQAALDPAVLNENIIEAMKLVVHAADIRIAVHPRQKQALLDALPRLRLQWPALEHVELVEDAALAPGGCRVYSKQGQIDGDLDGQLDRIIADLLPGAGEGETPSEALADKAKTGSAGASPSQAAWSSPVRGGAA